MPTALALASFAALALQAAGSGARPSWPAWRGADGTNVSAERGWSSEGAEEPLWKVQVGRGHSSVVVEDGWLYTQGFDEEHGVDRISCLHAESGKERWRHEYPAEIDALMHGGGTLSTPVVAGGVVYSFERQGVLRALDASSGKVLWQHDVAEDEAKPTDWGFASSPLVVGELVLVNAARVIAFERKSGEPRWASDDIGAYYSTPALCTIGGRARLASFTRPGLYLLELEDGQVLSHFPFKKGDTSVSASTPVVVDAQTLFISAGYGHGAALVDFSGAQPVAKWETKAMRTQLSGCVFVGGCFYGFDETMLKCLDLEGKERWRTRGLGMGALTASDGRLIVISGNGDLVVVAAKPEKYQELAKKRVLLGSSFWASPVLCDGRIYAKSGEGELVCLDHRSAEKPSR